MTPDERASLQATGNGLAKLLLNLSISVLSSGLFIGLCILSSLTLLNRGLRKSWARRAQFVALLLTLLTVVVSVVQPEVAIFQTLHLISYSVDTSESELALYVTLDWAQQISLLINDIVVIWRAWIIYPDKPVMRFLLCIPFFAALATGFAALALDTQYIVGTINGSISPSGVASKETMAGALNNAATALSLTTNLFATILIFFQLWRHQRSFDHTGLHHNSLTTSQRILLLLVEGGFIFCIGQAVSLFTGIYLNTNTQFTFGVGFTLQTLDNIFWASMPMYLPIVILLAENNRSISEYYFSFNSSLLTDVADVDATTCQEAGLKSSTVDDCSGTAQASSSTHEGNNNH